MTGRELVKHLLKLGSKNLDKDIIMFDGPSYYTPYKVEVINDKSYLADKFIGKILID